MPLSPDEPASFIFPKWRILMRYPIRVLPWEVSDFDIVRVGQELRTLLIREAKNKGLVLCCRTDRLTRVKASYVLVHRSYGISTVQSGGRNVNATLNELK